MHLTDKQIMEVADAVHQSGWNMDGAPDGMLIDFARAVLAKLGQPAASEAEPWPMLDDLHLRTLIQLYNDGYSKAYDGREFGNPCAATGSQAAAWELGKEDGTKAPKCGADSAVAGMNTASEAGAAALPAWWDTFIQNVCELPDRSSPEDDPEALIATELELRGCAERAIEDVAPSYTPAQQDTVAQRSPCKCGVCAECNWARSHPEDVPELDDGDDAPAAQIAAPCAAMFNTPTPEDERRLNAALKEAFAPVAQGDVQLSGNSGELTQVDKSGNLQRSQVDESPDLQSQAAQGDERAAVSEHIDSLDGQLEYLIGRVKTLPRDDMVRLTVWNIRERLENIRAALSRQPSAAAIVYRDCHSKIIKSLAAIARTGGPDTRNEYDPELIYRSPVMDEIGRIRDALDKCSAALAAAKPEGGK